MWENMHSNFLCYTKACVKMKKNMRLLREIRYLMKRNIEIIHDITGNKIVVINDIRFKGKRKIILI